jgi:hypothetical protein
VRVALSIIILLLIPINLMQTWQFQRAILHWQDTTAEMYWGNFFVLDHDNLRVPPPTHAP